MSKTNDYHLKVVHSRNPHKQDNRKLTYAECFREVPQLRSVSILHFQIGWTQQQRLKLDELVSMVRIGDVEDCYILASRFYELVDAFNVRALPVINSLISARELKELASKLGPHTTSQIYFNVYKRVNKR